jgi:hypothetical protein
VFHFGKVEIGSETALHELVGVVVEVHGEVKKRPRDGLVVDGDTGLIEMPSTRTKLGIARGQNRLACQTRETQQTGQ